MVRQSINPAPSAFRQRIEQAGEAMKKLDESISFADSFWKGTTGAYEGGKAQIGKGFGEILENKPASGVGDIVWGGVQAGFAPISGLMEPIREAATNWTGDPIFGDKVALLASTLFGKPVARRPLIPMPDGNVATIGADAAGKPEFQVIGKFPPEPQDFPNAAGAIVRKPEASRELTPVLSEGQRLAIQRQKPDPDNFKTKEDYFAAKDEWLAKGGSEELSPNIQRDITDANELLKSHGVQDTTGHGYNIRWKKGEDELYLYRQEDGGESLIAKNILEKTRDEVRDAIQAGLRRAGSDADLMDHFHTTDALSVEDAKRSMVQQKLHGLWEDQGLHPVEVAERVKDDSVMAHDLSAAKSPDLPLPERPSPQFIKEMEDKFHRLRTSAVADKAEFVNRLDALPESIKNHEVQELWYRHMEGDPEVTMPPELGKQYNEIMGPLKKEEAQLWEEAKKTDLAIDELNPSYAHRIVVGKNPAIDRMMGEGAEGNPIYNGPGLLKRTTSSMEARRFYALENAAGERQLVAVTKDGELVALAKGSKRELATGIEKPSIGDTFNVDGKEWKLTHALTNEIEGATSLRYYKNALANTIDNILHLRAVNRGVYTTQTIRDTPEWAQYTARRGEAGAPQDWRTPELSLFQNDVMDPKLANVIDDFYGKRRSDAVSETLYKINRFAVGSLFWTPLPHIFNAGSHWFIDRGWDWLNPKSYVSLAVDGANAIKSVVKQDATYQRMLRDGSGLIYGGIANREFYQTLLRESGMLQAPEFAEMAKTIGMSPLTLFNAMYNASSKALWAVSDMFMVQRLKELEGKGMAPLEAIEHAERHIPNYRLPSEILGSRSVRETFGNPFLFNFSRYHYGVLNGYANIVKELVSGKPDDMMHAVGAIMAFGALQVAIWPALSVLLQKATGDDRFSVPSYGPGRLARPVIGSVVQHTPDMWPEFVKDYYKDNPDFLQQLSNMVVFAPVVNYATEEFMNRYNFTGRSITEPSDWRHAWDTMWNGAPDAEAWANIARTQGEHAAQSVFLPYNSVNQAWRKGLDPGTAAIQSLFGVQYQTEEQEAGKARAFRYQDKSAIKRERKPIGLIENIGR